MRSIWQYSATLVENLLTIFNALIHHEKCVAVEFRACCGRVVQGCQINGVPILDSWLHDVDELLCLAPRPCGDRVLSGCGCAGGANFPFRPLVRRPGGL
jgi:hypothetical protein